MAQPSEVNLSQPESTNILPKEAVSIVFSRPTPTRVLARTAVLSTILGLAMSAIASDRVSAPPYVGSGLAAQRNGASKAHRRFETGLASWYGLHFQGRKTANGERYDMNSLTCAHRSLPLGSWIRVTNLHNRKAIFVRVNDRGPMTGKRIVDLSYAAANAVGLMGVGKVTLEPVRDSDPELTQALIAQLSVPAPLLLLTSLPAMMVSPER
jgi:rare lipoprotein A